MASRLVVGQPRSRLLFLLLLAPGCHLFYGYREPGPGPRDADAAGLLDRDRPLPEASEPPRPRHRAIRVRLGQVSGGPHANFPFLFNSTDGALRHTSFGGAVHSSKGWDIVFATAPDCLDLTACGGALEHEVERYNPVSGGLVAWIRLPQMDDGTTFYLHYGSSAVAASPESRTSVWDAGYVGVWHLAEAPPNAAIGGHIDSKHRTTAGALFNNGTPRGFAAAPSSTAGEGIAAGADRFHRPSATPSVENDDVIEIPHHPTLQPSGDMTLEAWIQPATLPEPGSGEVHLVAQKNLLSGPPWNTYQLFFRGDPGGPRLWFGWTNSSLEAYYAVNAGPFAADSWLHLAGVLVGNAVTLYVNGSAAGTSAGVKVGTPAASTGSLSLGNGANPRTGIDGVLDEVRLSTVARSPGWIATQYRNVSSPATFYELASP